MSRLRHVAFVFHDYLFRSQYCFWKRLNIASGRVAFDGGFYYVGFTLVTRLTEGEMNTLAWLVVCLFSFWAGGLMAFLVLGLCNAAAEGERQAEEAAKKARG